MNRPLKVVTRLISSGVFVQFNLMLPPAHAQIAGSNTGCPTGTRESTTNLVRNGTFSTNANTGLGVSTPPGTAPAVVDFTSDLPYRGDVVYPSDGPNPPFSAFGGGGISIQDEGFNGGQIPGVPASVVSGRGVTAQEVARVGIGSTPIPTYLYSNPNLNTAGQSVTLPGTPPPVIWSQTIAVAPSTVYNFKGLFFNLLLPNAAGLDPQIRLQVGPANIQTPIPIVVGGGTPIPGFPNIPNVRQAWIPVQFSFTSAPGQTSIQLRIVDETQNVVGDDFGLTAVGVRECIPNIGVAKQAGTPIANDDGSFAIPYTIRVRNFAPAVGFPDPYVLNNVQLTEDLATTFANATIVSIGNLQSSTLVVNPGFNGTTNTQLLQPGANSLAASAEGLVSFTVTIRPGAAAGGAGPYQNTAIATANTISGIQVLDRSNDGTDPNPSNNGDPTVDNAITLVGLPPAAVTTGSVLLVKRITNILRNGTPLAGVNFGAFADDPLSTSDNNPQWAQLNPPGAPVGVFNLSNNNPLQSGDEVEYTVYFLSNGAGPALGTSICDLVPAGTTFIPNSNQVRIGNDAVRSGGTVFTPLAPLPNNNSCIDQRNPNGAVIFDLGDLPNTPVGNLGFVRIRVRIN